MVNSFPSTLSKKCTNNFHFILKYKNFGVFSQSQKLYIRRNWTVFTTHSFDHSSQLMSLFFSNLVFVCKRCDYRWYSDFMYFAKTIDADRTRVQNRLIPSSTRIRFFFLDCFPNTRSVSIFFLISKPISPWYSFFLQPPLNLRNFTFLWNICVRCIQYTLVSKLNFWLCARLFESRYFVWFYKETSTIQTNHSKKYIHHRC